MSKDQLAPLPISIYDEATKNESSLDKCNISIDTSPKSTSFGSETLFNSSISARNFFAQATSPEKQQWMSPSNLSETYFGNSISSSSISVNSTPSTSLSSPEVSFDCTLISPSANLSIHDTISDNAQQLHETSRQTYLRDQYGYYIVAGREGKLLKCEDEPIHAPGAVQGYGVMIVIEIDERTGNLVVRQVSENSCELMGLSPQYLFSLECFTQVLPDSQADVLWDFICESDVDTSDELEPDDPTVFLLCGWGQPDSFATDGEESDSDSLRRRFWTCWCAVHRPPSNNSNIDTETNKGRHDCPLLVLEFELERDLYNPIYPLDPSQESSDNESTDSTSKSVYSNTLKTESQSSPITPIILNMDEIFLPSEPGDNSYIPSPEMIFDSTFDRSKPIKALTRMRQIDRTPGSAINQKDGHGSGNRHAIKHRSHTAAGGARSGVGTLDIFNVLMQIDEQLSSAQDIQSLLNIVVGVVKDLTQFHRVMVYQFDAEWNGEVVAELMDWKHTQEIYKGHFFPASDIPPQARKLYKTNKVRLLYDRAAQTARLVVRNKSELEYPLDMSNSYLRAMSPIHKQYLENMGVRSSMSISIIAFGELWGLISCHFYGDKGMRVSFPVRNLLRLLSESISRSVENLLYVSRLHAKKLIRTRPSTTRPNGYIVSDVDGLLELFDANFGALVIGGGVKTFSTENHQEEVMCIVDQLRYRQYSLTSVQATQSIKKDFPDMIRPPHQNVVSGLLCIPLSKGGTDFIVFMRKTQLRSIRWAGRPYKDKEESTSVLEPRKSFKTWMENITDQSKPWTEEQMETAGVFGLVYGKFINVWKENELKLKKNSRVVNLILSNAEHEIRTPLNHIINYLELALDQPLEPSLRNNLCLSHSVSKSLLFSIDALLDSTRSQGFHLEESFDVHRVIEDAIHPFKIEADRRSIQFQVYVEEVPRRIISSKENLHRTITILAANAFSFSDSIAIAMICKKMRDSQQTERQENGKFNLEISISDNGRNDSQIIKALKKYENIDWTDVPDIYSSSTYLDNFVALIKLVKQMNGQIKITPNPHGGSNICVLLVMKIELALTKKSQHNEERLGATNEITKLVRTLSTNPVKDRPCYVRGSTFNGKKDGKFDSIDYAYSTEDVMIRDTENLSSVYHTNELETTTQASHPVILRILIVDDDFINRTVLQKRLIKDGYSAETAIDGQACLELFKRDQEFDCIFMDIQMPVIDGFETTKRLRDLETNLLQKCTRASHLINGRVPLFAVSASLKESQRNIMLSSGMDGWILKPINFKRMKELLSGILINAQREKDVYQKAYKWENGGWLT